MYDDDDVFSRLTLDDAFVSGAATKELTAADRERKAIREQRDTEEWNARLRKQRRERRLHRRVARKVLAKNVWIPAIVVLVIVALVVRELLTGGSDTAWGNDQATASAVAANERPSPQKATSEVPLGRPPQVNSEGQNYAFMALQTGSNRPVAYDPCRPIALRVNARTAPKNGDALLQNALAGVSAATGLKFTIEGTTDEKPSDDRSSYQPDRYGDRWAPVLIAWSDPEEDNDLAGDTAGFAGSETTTTENGDAVYVSGTVALDGPDLREIIDAGYPEVAQAIIMHELGHLVGLDHVTDKRELMYPEGNTEVTDFAAGDRAGLALLGSGQCEKTL